MFRGREPLGLYIFEKVRDLYPDEVHWAGEDSAATFDMLVGLTVENIRF